MIVYILLIFLFFFLISALIFLFSVFAPSFLEKKGIDLKSEADYVKKEPVLEGMDYSEEALVFYGKTFAYNGSVKNKIDKEIYNSEYDGNWGSVGYSKPEVNEDDEKNENLSEKKSVKTGGHFWLKLYKMLN